MSKVWSYTLSTRQCLSINNPFPSKMSMILIIPASNQALITLIIYSKLCYIWNIYFDTCTYFHALQLYERKVRQYKYYFFCCHNQCFSMCYLLCYIWQSVYCAIQISIWWKNKCFLNSFFSFISFFYPG